MSSKYLLGFNKSLLFIACSSLISGCSSFGFHTTDNTLCKTCSPSSQPTLDTAEIASDQDTGRAVEANSTTLIADQIDTPKNTVVLAKVSASSVEPLKGPKALRDIQAISLDVNQGRKRQETASAATVFVTEDVQQSFVTPVTVASVELSSNLEVERVAPEISSVEQINRLIEESPTAAGVESAVVLNIPKAKVQPALQVINDSQLIDFGIWKIEKNWDDKHPGECRLSTATIQIDQHDFTTQLWLTVVDNRLLVNSTIDINIKQPGVGIKADNGLLQRFSEKVYSTNAVWSGNLNKTLKSNDQLRIILGGGELGKNTHETLINLDGLKKGYPEYQKCKG